MDQCIRLSLWLFNNTIDIIERAESRARAFAFLPFLCCLSVLEARALSSSSKVKCFMDVEHEGLRRGAWPPSEHKSLSVYYDRPSRPFSPPFAAVDGEALSKARTRESHHIYYRRKMRVQAIHPFLRWQGVKWKASGRSEKVRVGKGGRRLIFHSI